MLEITGNLWHTDFSDEFSLRCITTNGTIKANGAGVMGRGCAAEAKRMFPGLDVALGHSLKKRGNHFHAFRTSGGIPLAFFPVKHHWHEQADIVLIRRSANEAVAFADANPRAENILLPRPGCGNGRLQWRNVRSDLAAILDDRFTIITFA